MNSLYITYMNAFVTGFVVMAFEMLGGHYLNPYFGSSIVTWASIISVVLGALTCGYFVGGWLADKYPLPKLPGIFLLAASLYLFAVPIFPEELLLAISIGISDLRVSSLIASICLFFIPLAFLGTYSPFAIRLTLTSTDLSGRVSGWVYGVSTIGSIFGTICVAFFLITTIGSRSITFLLALITALAATTTFLSDRHFMARTSKILMETKTQKVLSFLALLCYLFGWSLSHASELCLEGAFSTMPNMSVDTAYNRVFIYKSGPCVKMTFRLVGGEWSESVMNLADPTELPSWYTRVITVGMAYTEHPKSILMLGVGGGTTINYLAHYLAEARITGVDLDPKVLEFARTEFHLRESEAIHLIDGDGRIFLMRTKEQFDLIILDAYRGGYVPSHMLTKEFYSLVLSHLSPGGAVSINLHSRNALFDSSLRTIKEVFPTVIAYPYSSGTYA